MYGQYFIYYLQGSSAGGVVLLADADVSISGSKAAACGRLASLSEVSEKGNLWVD